MSAKTIPKDVKQEVQDLVAHFNQTQINNPDCFYVPRYRGLFLYLDRSQYGRVGPICRLKYTGEPDAWEFAIYKYSDERYDAEEWVFPGSEHVDGTVQGALEAGLEAYPLPLSRSVASPGRIVLVLLKMIIQLVFRRH